MISCVKLLSLITLILGDYATSEEEKNRDFAFPGELRIHHHHHHHDFYHSPEFHRKNDKTDENKSNNETLEIPLDYIQNLNEYNVSDLLLHFVDGEEDQFIQNRFGDDGAEERSAATMPKGAECIPELKTVEMATSDDPSILYIPQCTRIERCGGCCRHNLLSCQPLKKEFVPFKIFKTQYTGGTKLKKVQTEVVMIEKHSKCKCLCRVQPQDCTKFQEYKESECRCACKNHDEKKKCLLNHEKKLWDPELCACQCRDTLQCSTGSIFDQNECKCVPLNRRIGVLKRNSRIVPPFF